MPTAAELRKLPCVLISGFDFDEAGVSQPLGTAKLFIHEITSVPTPSKISLPLRRSDGAQFLPADVQTRVLRKTLPLSGLPAGVTSLIKVEAFFLAPITTGRESSPSIKWEDIGRRRGDIYESNALTRKETGNPFLVLPKYDEVEEARTNAQCYCHHPLLTVGEYRQSMVEAGEVPPPLVDGEDEGARKICNGSLQAAIALGTGGEVGHYMCNALRGAYDLIENSFEEDERFHDFREASLEDEGDDAIITGLIRGRTFKRTLRFLPTIICPIPSPRAVFAREDCDPPREKWERDGSTGYSELQCLVCVDSQKPNTSYKLASMVRAMEFCDHAEQLIWGSEVGGRDAWIEPPQFLETRQGDLKSHVALLASLLLGLNVDAYVCIGKVAQYNEDGEDIGEPRKHIWLMTRESDSRNCRLPFSQNTDPLPECDREGREVPMNAFGAVKFWEITSSGQLATEPLPNRWAGRDDLQAFEAATKIRKKPKAARKVVDEANITEVAPASESDDSDDDEFDRPPKEEEMLDNPAYLSAQKNADNFTETSRLYETTAGLDGDWGRPDQQEIMAKRNEEFKLRHEMRRANKEARLKAEEEADAASKDPSFIARTIWIKRDKRTASWARRTIPYVSMVAVFNHKNIWLNVQETVDPCLMSYDFQLGTRAGWYPVMDQGICLPRSSGALPETWRGNTVFPFYESPVLIPPISSEQLQFLEEQITTSVMAYLTNAREATNLPTKWAKDEIGPVLGAALSAETELRMLPKILKNGWDQEDTSRK
jgi:hypothetical protein